MKLNKVEKSWIMNDVANSSFAVIMLAAIFPTYFASICSATGAAGDFWWGIGTSIATGVIGVCAPFIGAIADFHGMKKKLYSAFLAIGLIFALLSIVVDTWQLILVAYIFSYMGYLGSNLVSDSLLTDVTTPDKMDKVASSAFAYGYIGGSTIPFLMSIAIIMFGENFGIDSVMAVKISIIIMVLWWGLCSIPYLMNVEQTHGVDKGDTDYIKNTFKGIFKTAKKIYLNKAMFLFMLAYFFYIDGVNTVIAMSTSYGTALGLDTTGMILALLVTQLVAFPCSLIFGRFSTKYGSILMIKGALLMYFAICIVAFIMGFGMEEVFLTNSQALSLFWLLAFLVGTVQGGIQSISKSYFAKLVPVDNSGEYFGFFDIFGKFAAVLGPLLYSGTYLIFGRSSFAILSIMLLFVAGFVVLHMGRKEFLAVK